MGNEIKHTPGPWYCDKQPKGAFKISQHGDAHPVPGHIATVGSANLVPVAQEHAEANTKLIAAAPELLEALKKEQEWRDREAAGELDEEWDYETMVGQYRRAAITKATT